MTLSLTNFVHRFRGRHVGVIGDLMLDHFIHGEVERISPEAPVPVVNVTREFYTPGGAGNVAANITALGGKASLIGLVGADAAGVTLLQEFSKRHIDCSGIVRHRNHRTIEKVRIVARGQHMVRLDREVVKELNGQVERKVLAHLVRQLPTWDAVVLSDYSKGMLTKHITQRIIAYARRRKKFVVADPKPAHARYFRGVSIVAPNLKEAREIALVDDLKRAGRTVRRLLRCDVLVTQGAQGMTLFTSSGERHFPAKAREVFDVVGAGDTVMATLVLGLAAGAKLAQAVTLANHAAGIVVGKIGSATVSAQELINDLAQR
ncbi:MAG: D-glycero-beta-D-manno-heptose-7-phosphate kinase [Candidatus Kerfeldbacteria bacterium]|nr:D-glycero-beta-D-manno-heptose-7-phosphate kinase [Candidatus Kerfeldbacteria bacterium]